MPAVATLEELELRARRGHLDLDLWEATEAVVPRRAFPDEAVRIRP